MCAAVSMVPFEEEPEGPEDGPAAATALRLRLAGIYACDPQPAARGTVGAKHPTIDICVERKTRTCSRQRQGSFLRRGGQF